VGELVLGMNVLVSLLVGWSMGRLVFGLVTWWDSGSLIR
jgi:hypothetical protein